MANAMVLVARVRGCKSCGCIPSGDARMRWHGWGFSSGARGGRGLPLCRPCRVGKCGAGVSRTVFHLIRARKKNACASHACPGWWTHRNNGVPKERVLSQRRNCCASLQEPLRWCGRNRLCGEQLRAAGVANTVAIAQATQTQVGWVTTTVVHAFELQQIDSRVPWEAVPVFGMASATDLGWAASDDWLLELSPGGTGRFQCVVSDFLVG